VAVLNRILNRLCQGETHAENIPSRVPGRGHRLLQRLGGLGGGAPETYRFPLAGPLRLGWLQGGRHEQPPSNGSPGGPPAGRFGPNELGRRRGQTAPRRHDLRLTRDGHEKWGGLIAAGHNATANQDGIVAAALFSGHKVSLYDRRFKVADRPPAEWKTVRVDLWAVFKRSVRIRGMRLASTGGPAAFDQILLGRAEEDLPRVRK
jgi:hypothetical protein